MSGGPVFGPDLWLGAIVCAGNDFPPLDDGGPVEATSFALTLLALMGSTLKEIADRGFMRIAGVDQTSLSYDEDGRVKTVHWR
jgi:hypothetical protein